MSQTTLKPGLVIRQKDFARRLELACQGNPNCPTDEYRGKQKWLKEQLQNRHQIKTSSEAVSRWFSGVMKPRQKTIDAIAQILEVDAVWLSLGVKPDMTKNEKKVRDAQVSGMVNLVAGMIQMAGGTIAFPAAQTENDPDILAIVKGTQHQIKVALAVATGDNNFRFAVPTQHEGLTVIGLIDEGGMGYTLLRITSDIIAAHGARKGEHTIVEIKKSGRMFLTGGDFVPRIHDAGALEGSTKK